MINGTNNLIRIHKNCRFGPGCIFQADGNNISIEIGDECSFTREVAFCAQENGTKINIGNQWMFSRDIIVRTSDSHPMYDGNNNRINHAKNVNIGNHVWIAPSSSIMKGAIIGDDSIIGSHTMVNKEIPVKCLAVGMPAKVVKENVYWTNEKLF